MLDATTAIEDKDFWINAGFDPLGIISAGLDTISGRPRGASTITQQLVRNRLLPAEAFEDSTYERKVREIIQSIRLTEAYPGDKGKQEIITAYLNNNFYGNSTYGVKAAAKGYFGKKLEDLTLAEYAILAAIPQSPTRFDLVRNAEEVCLDEVEEGAEAAADAETVDCKEIQLVVPDTSEIVQRRNYVLDLMRTRSPLTGTKHRPAEYEAAKLEPVVITKQISATWRAPHFVWQVREALTAIVCPDTPQRLHRGRHGRVPRHDEPRLGHAEDHREVGLRRGPGAAIQEHAQDPRAQEDPGAGMGLDPQPQGPQPPQRRGRRHRLPDR